MYYVEMNKDEEDIKPSFSVQKKKKKKNYRDQERIFNSSVKLVLRYGWKLGEKPPGR